MTTRRFYQPPVDTNALPRVAMGASARVALAEDPQTHGFTILLVMPPSEVNRNAPFGFEYHTGHEEIFNLDGTMNFGPAAAPHYSWSAPAYLNHPPYWIHPADQNSPTGVTLLIKISKPVDFVFHPIPAGWAGQEYVHGDAPAIPAGRGVSHLQLDDLPWEPAHDVAGAPLGFEAKRVYDDPTSGWTTTLVRFPPGFRSARAPIGSPAGDEWFVLDGDITLARADAGRLGPRWWFCDPAKRVEGGESSEAGCTAIRWVRGPGAWAVPPLRY